MKAEPDVARGPSEEFRGIVIELYGECPSDIALDEIATRLLTIYRGLSDSQPEAPTGN